MGATLDCGELEGPGGGLRPRMSQNESTVVTGGPMGAMWGTPATGQGCWGSEVGREMAINQQAADQTPVGSGQGDSEGLGE